LLREAQSVIIELGAALKPYFKHPNPASVLVIELEKLDGRTSFAGLVKKKGMIIQCNILYDRPKPWLRLPPWDNDLVKWIQHCAKRYHKKIAPQVAFELTQRIGSSLSELSEEIIKLTIFIGDCEEITLAHLQSLIKNRKRSGIFPLIDGISVRDLAIALKHLRTLFLEGIVDHDNRLVTQHKDIAIIILGSLYRKFKQLWKFRHRGEMPSSLPGFIQKKLQQEGRHFSPEELSAALQLILDTDYALKTSPLSPEIILERLILTICSRKCDRRN
jgi:DNA polymerase-3 subunit delta